MCPYKGPFIAPYFPSGPFRVLRPCSVNMPREEAREMLNLGDLNEHFLGTQQMMKFPGARVPRQNSRVPARDPGPTTKLRGPGPGPMGPMGPGPGPMGPKHGRCRTYPTFLVLSQHVQFLPNMFDVSQHV